MATNAAARPGSFTVLSNQVERACVHADGGGGGGGGGWQKGRA